MTKPSHVPSLISGWAKGLRHLRMVILPSLSSWAWAQWAEGAAARVSWRPSFGSSQLFSYFNYPSLKTPACLFSSSLRCVSWRSDLSEKLGLSIHPWGCLSLSLILSPRSSSCCIKRGSASDEGRFRHTPPPFPLSRLRTPSLQNPTDHFFRTVSDKHISASTSSCSQRCQQVYVVSCLYGYRRVWTM